MAARTAALATRSWKPAGDGIVCTAADRTLRERLTKLGVAFEFETAAAEDPGLRERLDAVRRWCGRDWLTIDPKLRSSIIEGLGLLLWVFALPDVGATFSPPKPVGDPPPSPSAPAPETVAVARRLRWLDEVIDSGKSSLPEHTRRDKPGPLPRGRGAQAGVAPDATAAAGMRLPPAKFLCDEYQTFATLGEDDPAGDGGFP